MPSKFSVFRRAALAAGALATLVASSAAAQEKRCEMKLIGELPVKLDADSRPMIEGTVNGQPIRILANIGGNATYMTEPLAKSLGLRVVPDDSVILYKNARTSQLAGMSTVDTFSFGGSVIKKQRFSIWPSDSAYIVLGRPFWAMADVEFDLAHNMIRMFRPVNCGDQPLAYWGPDHGVAPLRSNFKPGDSYVVEVQLNGKPVGARLSSTFSTSAVATRVSADAGVPTDAPAVTPQPPYTLSDGKKAPAWLGVFGTFSIADESIRNAKLRISDAFIPPDVENTPLGSRVGRDIFERPQMILGADFLRSHRVLISNSQKKVYFSYTGGPVFQVTGPVTVVGDE